MDTSDITVPLRYGIIAAYVVRSPYHQQMHEKSGLQGTAADYRIHENVIVTIEYANHALCYSSSTVAKSTVILPNPFSLSDALHLDQSVSHDSGERIHQSRRVARRTSMVHERAIHRELLYPDWETSPSLHHL